MGLLGEEWVWGGKNYFINQKCCDIIKGLFFYIQEAINICFYNECLWIELAGFSSAVLEYVI